MRVAIFEAHALPPSARKPSLFRRAALLALGPKISRRARDLNVIFMKGSRMRVLNKQFLNHDYDTDVIAFPYDEGSSAFGDVFISVNQARRQARDLGHSLLEELLTLILHGTLHLIGYRDDTRAAQKKMFQKQDRLLKKLRVPCSSETEVPFF